MPVMDPWRLDALVWGLTKLGSSLVITGLYSLPKLLALALGFFIIWNIVQILRRK